MALQTLSELDQFKSNQDHPFPPGYPENVRTFYSPVDDVHSALKALLESAEMSIVIAMYGYDDEELNRVIRGKLESETVFVSLSLDKTQASGVNDKKILATWLNDDRGNSIAIGRSVKGAIMHLKLVIIDGVDVLTGSTNWSTGGQTKQDNQLMVVRDPIIAAEARGRIDIIHDQMLKQMAKQRARRAKAARSVRLRPASDTVSAVTPKRHAV
jgi:phosphatidylserine/phosphatidylglycerophosphate/cardiolipin synthase-like enzyme